jgi:hypothetical protein
MIPGRLLHRIAALVCSGKSRERVVEPAIADLQREQGTLALIGSYIAVLKVIAICAVDMSDATPDDRRVVTRTLGWAFVLTCAVALLLVLPSLLTFPEVRGWSAAIALLPQALPLAIPIAMVFAVAAGVSGRATRHVVRAIVLASVVAALLSFGLMAWGIPAGNQAFRELAAEAARSNGELVVANMEKGPWEMTLSELRHEIAARAAGPDPTGARFLSWTFHLHFALAIAALAVAALLLAVPVKVACSGE